MNTAKHLTLSLTLLALCSACHLQTGSLKEAAEAGLRGIDSAFGTGFSSMPPAAAAEQQAEVQPDRDLTDVARFIAPLGHTR